VQVAQWSALLSAGKGSWEIQGVRTRGKGVGRSSGARLVLHHGGIGVMAAM
jgi:hypothetical protein